MITVWIQTGSRLINEALATLMGETAFEVVTGGSDPPPADVAIRSLRGLHPPYSPPPDLPTLALIDSTMVSSKVCTLRAGYQGYLSGEEDAASLEQAVETVLQGEIWAERAILSHFVSASEMPSLTPREHQVLSLICEGLSNKRIAQRLGISEKTVKVHVSNVLTKHNVKNRTALILQRST